MSERADPLVECTGCRRLAFAVDRKCPFCAAALPEPEPTAPFRWAGPLTRAAVFYGASALALASCTEEADESPAPSRTQVEAREVAPEATTQPAEAVAPAEEPPPEEDLGPPEDDPATARAERTDAEERKRRYHEEQQLRLRRRVMMPYGAPPFDFIV